MSGVLFCPAFTFGGCQNSAIGAAKSLSGVSLSECAIAFAFEDFWDEISMRAFATFRAAKFCPSRSKDEIATALNAAFCFLRLGFDCGSQCFAKVGDFFWFPQHFGMAPFRFCPRQFRARVSLTYRRCICFAIPSHSHEIGRHFDFNRVSRIVFRNAIRVAFPFGLVFPKNFAKEFGDELRDEFLRFRRYLAFSTHSYGVWISDKSHSFAVRVSRIACFVVCLSSNFFFFRISRRQKPYATQSHTGPGYANFRKQRLNAKLHHQILHQIHDEILWRNQPKSSANGPNAAFSMHGHAFAWVTGLHWWGRNGMIRM